MDRETQGSPTDTVARIINKFWRPISKIRQPRLNQTQRITMEYNWRMSHLIFRASKLYSHNTHCSHIQRSRAWIISKNNQKLSKASGFQSLTVVPLTCKKLRLRCTKRRSPRTLWECYVHNSYWRMVAKRALASLSRTVWAWWSMRTTTAVMLVLAPLTIV